MLSVLVPMPAAATSSADAWMSARLVQQTHSTAIGEAAQALAEGSSPRELRELRTRVATAVRAMDRLDVRACFQVWWSYVRSSYVLFDQALVGLERNDAARVQSAVAASSYMSALAASARVDCPRNEVPTASGLSLPSREPRPLVVAVDLPI